jgi:hypothetical protein
LPKDYVESESENDLIDYSEESEELEEEESVSFSLLDSQARFELEALQEFGF